MCITMYMCSVGFIFYNIVLVFYNFIVMFYSTTSRVDLKFEVLQLR